MVMGPIRVGFQGCQGVPEQAMETFTWPAPRGIGGALHLMVQAHGIES